MLWRSLSWRWSLSWGFWTIGKRRYRNVFLLTSCVLSQHSQSNVQKSKTECSQIKLGLTQSVVESGYQTLTKFDFWTNRSQSSKLNPVELIPEDCVWLSYATKLSRTQSNGLRLIVGSVNSLLNEDHSCYNVCGFLKLGIDFFITSFTLQSRV